MTRIASWVQGFALSMGGPGLFVIAFLDSSFLSLPEINDLLIVWMVTRHKERMVYYATMATLGSIAGCMVLYAIGRKGGDALVRRRFKADRIERGMALFRRHGLLAVLVPALLPPPAPFKIFVLLAGVSRVPVTRFMAAIAVGRGLRYFAEGTLAVWYGDEAIRYLRENIVEASLITAGLVVGGALGYWIWQRRRPVRVGAPEG
jgi:membrane protein YqaA with SNARE-associated domain